MVSCNVTILGFLARGFSFRLFRAAYRAPLNSNINDLCDAVIACDSKIMICRKSHVRVIRRLPTAGLESSTWNV